MPGVDFFGRRVYQSVQVNIDEDTLRKVADTTGGRYFRATDTDSLRNIYAEINKLETTKTEEKRYLQYSELATQSVRVGRFRLPPLLWCAFVLLGVEMVLANTAFRRVP